MSSVKTNITYNNVSTSQSNVKAKLTLNAVARYKTSGGCTEDHSKLQNLDYDHSGHTGFVSTADLEIVKATKQNKLVAGANIDINSVTNVIKAIIPDAKINKSFTTNITVGHLPSGTVITPEMTISDILYRILYAGAPVEVLKAFYYQGTIIPSGINNDWTSESIDESVKTTGIIHIYTPQVKSYYGFAYNKSLGRLKHIYENGLTTFDLIDDFICREVVYGNTTYYMYYLDEKGIAVDDQYQFLWN